MISVSGPSVCVRRFGSRGGLPPAAPRRRGRSLGGAGAWHRGVVARVGGLPALPSTSLRAITPAQGGRLPWFRCAGGLVGIGVVMHGPPLNRRDRAAPGRREGRQQPQVCAADAAGGVRGFAAVACGFHLPAARQRPEPMGPGRFPLLLTRSPVVFPVGRLSGGRFGVPAGRLGVVPL